MQGRFEDTYFSRDDRYSIGIDRKLDDYYVSIPVSNGIVDYEEYYRITREQYDCYMADQRSALEFVAMCRRHECDDLLIQKPGRNRGTPV
jgi:hypothetical protein